MKQALLKEEANMIRRFLLRTIFNAHSGHPGGSLSSVEVVTALYFDIMRIDPSRPAWSERDRFIMSKGHASALWYTVLAKRGYFDLDELDTFRKISSRLQGHPDMRKTPGVDMTTGSLGQGLSAGVGIALSSKIKKTDFKTFVLLGDGELNEGQIWEAAMAASRFKLNNLFAIIDHNKLQLDGPTEEIMPLEPLSAKWRSFNWNVFEVAGNDMDAVTKKLRHITDMSKDNVMPNLLIAHTTKGYGVGFMENKLEWHGKVICKEEFDRAIRSLEEECFEDDSM